eukprot:m.36786 g.36786  ORF g.36786 m.36786 type:complete len:856 (-) comp9187_c0_seq1:246-2813(-)
MSPFWCLLVLGSISVTKSLQEQCSQSQCEIEVGVDLYGNDIPNYNAFNSAAKSVESCAELCIQTTHCTHFTFVWNLCFLKTAGSGRNPNQKAISGSCSRGTVQFLHKVHEKIEGCDVYQSLELDGNNIGKMKQTPDMKSCISLCLETAGCSHAVYKDGICNPKSGDRGNGIFKLGCTSVACAQTSTSRVATSDTSSSFTPTLPKASNTVTETHTDAFATANTTRLTTTTTTTTTTTSITTTRTTTSTSTTTTTTTTTTSSSSTSTTQGCPTEKGCRIRYDYVELSVKDREHYQNVFLDVSQGTDKYTKMPHCANLKADLAKAVRKHSSTKLIHTRTQLLGWHRWFMVSIEDVLRKCDPCITIPYWAWERDPDVWGTIWKDRADWQGGKGDGIGGCVQDGPFKETKYVLPEGALADNDGKDCLRRKLDGDLPVRKDVTENQKKDHTEWTEWHKLMDKWHSDVHLYIAGYTSRDGFAGTMRYSTTSANAPVFYQHHGNLDRLWYEWQKQDEKNLHKSFGDVLLKGLGGLTHNDVKDSSAIKMVAGSPDTVCVEYGYKKAPSPPACTGTTCSLRRRRGQLDNHTLEDYIAHNGVDELLASLHPDFFNTTSPYWNIPTTQGFELEAVAVWDKMVVPEFANMTIDEIISNKTIGNEHRLNQPVLNLTADPLPYLGHFNSTQRILGAERALTNILGMSASGFRDALDIFDNTGNLTAMFDMAFEEFTSAGCISNGRYYANDIIVTTSVCKGDCKCSNGAIVCSEPYIPYENNITYTELCCCSHDTADCLSCKEGLTVQEYCALNPSAVGCPKPDCCSATTANCISCQLGMTEEELCALVPQTIGCSFLNGTDCDVMVMTFC